MSDYRHNKVAYVVKRYPRFSETFIVNEILAHERAGWDIRIISLLPPVDTHFQPAIGEVRAPVHYLPSRPKVTDLWPAIRRCLSRYDGATDVFSRAENATAREVSQAAALAALSEELGITHMHAHFATSAAEVTRIASRLTDIPYSMTAHAKDIFHADVCKQDLERKIADATRVVTVSDFNVAHLHREFPSNSDQIVRIYNGMNVAELTFREPGNGPPLIVAVGRLVEKKGFTDLIDACSILHAQGSNLQCKILGYGPLHDSLQGQIDSLGLRDVVHLIGSTPHCEVVHWLRKAALLVAPCVNASDGDRDGLPTVVLEAMALGTPCVGTEVTGMPEVIKDNETGFSIPQHDPNAMAKRVDVALSDLPLRQQVARVARERIEAEFNIEKNSSRLRLIFGGSYPNERLPKSEVA